MKPYRANIKHLNERKDLEEGGDYSGYDFFDFAIHEECLSKAYFNGSSMVKGYICGVNLYGSEFGESSIKEVEFTGCNIDNSDFVGAIITDCTFDNCSFEDGEWRDTKFSNVHFVNCSFGSTTIVLCYFDSCYFSPTTMESITPLSVNYNVFLRCDSFTHDMQHQLLVKNFGINKSRNQPPGTSLQLGNDSIYDMTSMEANHELSPIAFINSASMIIDEIAKSYHRKHNYIVQFLSLIVGSFIASGRLTVAAIVHFDNVLSNKVHAISSQYVFKELMQIRLELRASLYDLISKARVDAKQLSGMSAGSVTLRISLSETHPITIAENIANCIGDLAKAKATFVDSSYRISSTHFEMLLSGIIMLGFLAQVISYLLGKVNLSIALTKEIYSQLFNSSRHKDASSDISPQQNHNTNIVLVINNAVTSRDELPAKRYQEDISQTQNEISIVLEKNDLSVLKVQGKVSVELIINE